MLETEISKLTDQVIRLNELLSALLSSKSDAPAAPVVSVSDAALVSAAVKLESAVASAPAPAPVAPAPAPVAPAPAPVAPAPAPAPVQTEPAAPVSVAPAPAAPVSAAITLESLRQLCVAKAKKDYANSARIRGILAPYSVANIQSLKPEDYSAVYAAVEAL